MKYTYDDMLQFYLLYDSSEYGNRDSFIKKMKEFNVSEKESTIIWQSFDIATDRLYISFRNRGNSEDE